MSAGHPYCLQPLTHAPMRPPPAGSGCPCFKSCVMAVQGLKKRFHLTLPEPQVRAPLSLGEPKGAIRLAPAPPAPS